MSAPVARTFRGGEMTVVEGRDDWLFIGEFEGIDAMAVYTDADAIPDEVYEIWQRTLTARREHFDRAGIAYLSVVVPDACVVYPEKLPEGLEVVSPTPYHRLVAGLDDATRAQCVYPLDALVAARQVRDTFQRTDSHWTDWGAFVGYRAAMEALAPRVPGLAILDEADLEWTERPSFGALGSVVVPERSEQLHVARVRDDRTHRVAHVMTHVRDAYTVVEQDRPDLPTAVVFRDSAMTAASKFFSQSFRRTVYVSSPNIVMYDLVEREQPDVVIHEFGERRMLHVPRKPTMTDFAYVFGDLLLADERAINHQRKARTLLAAGKAADALTESDAALATSEPNGRLLVFRSTAYAQMGEPEAALESLRHATLLDRRDAFAGHLFSQALRRSGRRAAGYAEALRVLGLDDRHFAYWSEAVAGAIETDDHTRATQLADAAVARFGDNAEAHYASACAHTALGDLARAELDLRRALELMPDSDAFRRQLATVLVQGERWREAEETIVDLLERSPEETPLRAALTHVRARLGPDA